VKFYPRSYAISQSKILVAYLVTLALARWVTFLAAVFLGFFQYRDGGIKIFAVDFSLMTASVSIGTAFGA
jgi:hypothetical protein